MKQFVKDSASQEKQPLGSPTMKRAFQPGKHLDEDYDGVVKDMYRLWLALYADGKGVTTD